MKHKKYHFNDFNIESYFNKIYEFNGNEDWKLPEKAFKSPKWSVDTLQEKKFKLNSVKEQLSDFDLAIWSQHTKKRDPSSSIIKSIRYRYQPELLTQAWCKFYECLSRNHLLPEYAIEAGNLRTLHICEAPGGFIAALNHFLQLFHPNVKLDWLATTLNPEYEGNPLNHMIPDDRLIVHTKKNWNFGLDGTGDITKYYNHKFICNDFEDKGKASLVTADGSVNCMDDPGDQERNVSPLHYCELITALSVLKEEGTFILKIFTSFEESTICQLYLLNCTFKHVAIFKPITSKSGNSESYVICKKFKGLDSISKIWPELIDKYESPSNNSMFNLTDLNESFLTQIHESAEFFMQKQIKTINDNIRNFTKMGNSGYEIARLKAFHAQINDHFLKVYFIDSIDFMNHLVPCNNINTCNTMYKSTQNESYLRYYNKNRSDMKVSIKTGKSISKILYSQYCNDKMLNSINPISIIKLHDNRTLFSLTKEQLNCNIYTSSDFNYINNSKFQKELFNKIHSNFNNKDIILVNIPLLSNFLVSLLYLISSMYKTVYFFKNGIVYFSQFDANCIDKIKHLFDTIVGVYNDCTVDINNPFEKDILSILEGNVDNHFKHCIWFYNENLMLRP